MSDGKSKCSTLLDRPGLLSGVSNQELLHSQPSNGPFQSNAKLSLRALSVLLQLSLTRWSTLTTGGSGAVNPSADREERKIMRNTGKTGQYTNSNYGKQEHYAKSTGNCGPGKNEHDRHNTYANLVLEDPRQGVIRRGRTLFEQFVNTTVFIAYPTLSPPLLHRRWRQYVRVWSCNRTQRPSSSCRVRYPCNIPTFLAHPQVMERGWSG